ncbi:Hypothetical protein (plasmid) [Pseudomonas putida]|nr:Hypothetical protein [Pseudomonas putida]
MFIAKRSYPLQTGDREKNARLQTGRGFADARQQQCCTGRLNDLTA